MQAQPQNIIWMIAFINNGHSGREPAPPAPTHTHTHTRTTDSAHTVSCTTAWAFIYLI